MQNSSMQALTAAQKKAVKHLEGPLLVIAGPGSGKTRVITYRIAALIDAGVPPYNICAVTFTNKAADEMAQRVLRMGTPPGAQISTFHSLCVRILREFASRADTKPNFTIYDASDQAVTMKQAVKLSELDTSNFPPARMRDAVSTLKSRLITTSQFEKQADDFFSKALLQIYKKYQKILAENNALDFDDLLLKTAFLLEGSPDVCNKLGNRFKFLLIDEYQDTNHAQYRIAKALASSHNNICATGDPDQSIYRWRGADIRNILAFEEDWPDAKIVKLEKNFRSTPNILKAADNLISENQNRKLKKLVPTKPSAEEVEITCCEDEFEEADNLAEKIKKLAENGTSLSDCAVFYRVNSASRVIEEALIKNKIPYQIVRGVEFYSRKEIRDILAYLKILVNPDDQTSLLRIINTPPRGIGKTSIQRIRDYALNNNITFYEALKKPDNIKTLSTAPRKKIAAFFGMIEGFKKNLDSEIAPLIERVFVESSLKKSLQDAGEEKIDAIQNVEELINAAAQYDSETEKPSLLDYLQQISLFTDADSYDTITNKVALMTLHAAKGLEFENVFIIALEDGLLPHERSSNEHDQIEEERRLFFVGITRAKSLLNISFAKYRTFRGQLLRSIPSPFLYELGIDFQENSSNLQSRFSDTSSGEPYYESLNSTEQQPRFRKGALVRHPTFGLGRVQQFNDMGENSTVTIKFNTGQTKTLMLKYAKLTKTGK